MMKLWSRILYFHGLFFIFLAASANAMTVEEAYRAIPHERTTLDTSAAKMSPDETEFLEAFFELTDLGVVEKVEAMSAFGQNRPITSLATHYDDLESRLKVMRVPQKLKTVHSLVLGAIQDERRFLQEWNKRVISGGRQEPFQANHPLISSASGKLRSAYGELMRLYPSEGPRNKKAFYNYLCALDFV